MITSIQKIVKIGSSEGVTLPAKELQREGFRRGDEVKVTVEWVTQPAQDQVEMVALTQRLIERHIKALKNLSQR